MPMDISTFFLLYGLLILIGYMTYRFLRSPFHYPYYIHYFDVSRKRNPQIDDQLDRFIIDGNFFEFQDYLQELRQWKNDCEEKISKSLLKNYRRNQYLKCLDDDHAFIFYLSRQQTRYRQVNYIKTPYKVSQTSLRFVCNFAYLLNRNQLLKDIDYACTLREYHSKNQRKLLTKELRQKIMIRDHYTCQVCGKYMPDEVGLQIDHIIPVSKGGKTIASNLQVLCSKCNGSKSNRI